MGRTTPKIAPYRGRISTPDLTHGSLGPAESDSQTASRAAEPFLSGSRTWTIDNRVTPSEATGRSLCTVDRCHHSDGGPWFRCRYTAHCVSSNFSKAL